MAGFGIDRDMGRNAAIGVGVFLVVKGGGSFDRRIGQRRDDQVRLFDIKVAPEKSPEHIVMVGPEAPFTLRIQQADRCDRTWASPR